MKKSLFLFHILPFSVLGRPLPTVQNAPEQSPTSISPTNINQFLDTIINDHDQYQHQHQQPLSPSPPPPPHPSGTSPKTTTITTTKPPPSPPSLSNEEEKEEESPWKWNLSDGTTPPEVLLELEFGSGTMDSDSEPEIGTGAVPSTSSTQSSTADSIINDNININTAINNEIHEYDTELGDQTQTQTQTQKEKEKGHGKFLPPHNNTINNLNHPTPLPSSENPDPSTQENETISISIQKTYFRHLRPSELDINVDISTPAKRSNALLNAHADRIAVVGVLVLVPVSVLVVWMGEFVSRVWEERRRGRRRRYRSLSRF